MKFGNSYRVEELNEIQLTEDDVLVKGELMGMVYTHDELMNIDNALPQSFIEDNSVDDFWFVMNYNNSIFGVIEDIRVVAKQRNINIES